MAKAKSRYSIPEVISSRLQGIVSSIFLLSLILFLLKPAEAQPQSSLPTLSQSLEVQVSQLEQNYDNHISNMIAGYFDRGTYIVNVNIDAEFHEETTGRTTDTITREPRGGISMPGMPYVPEENIRPEQRYQSETTVREHTVQSLRIRNLNVTVFADTMYSDDQMDFISLLASIASKANPQRGDQVTVSSFPIPSHDREGMSPSEMDERELAPSRDILAHINQYLPGILLLLFVLLYLANRFQSASEFQRRGDNTFRNSRDRLRSEENENEFFQQELEENIYSPPSSPDDHEAIKFTPSEPSFGTLNEKLDEVLRLFIQSPRDVSMLFEYWVSDDPQGGAKRAAKIVRSINDQLLDTLSGHLSDEEIVRIKSALQGLGKLTAEEKNDVADQFLRVFSAQSNENSGSRFSEMNLFRYLNHMDDQQVEKLLLGVNPRAAAVTIDNMAPERAASILESMESEPAARIMIELAELPQLHYKEYEKISSKIFSTAVDLLRREQQQKSGVEQILPLLRRMPVKDQQRFTKQIEYMGSSVGSTIRDEITMPEQIPALDDHIIGESIRQLDTQTLLHALSDMPEDAVSKILKHRPGREQKLILREIERNTTLNPARVKRSQLILMNAVQENRKKYS